jgi:hypothetical protein
MGSLIAAECERPRSASLPFQIRCAGRLRCSYPAASSADLPAAHLDFTALALPRDGGHDCLTLAAMWRQSAHWFANGSIAHFLDTYQSRV